MNDIILQGRIRDIAFSHDIGNVEYGKANLICIGQNGKEDDIISLRFKKFVNRYHEGDLIELRGNLRSYSQKFGNDTKVEIYVFTYFDIPASSEKNQAMIDGNICKMGKLSVSKYGKYYLHFTLANNIFTPGGKKLNNYIPCTAYGDMAVEIANKFNVKDHIELLGNLHSHTYKKRMKDGSMEYRIAHEVVIKRFN